tara:strand:- start:31 stop:1266 length:1236 start_codon:yes stop_codon:yes gene_type:complete
VNSRQLRNIFKRIVDRDGYNEILGMCGSKLDEHFNFLDFKNNLRDFDHKKLNLFIDENGVLILYRPAEFINPRSVSQKCWNYFSDYMIENNIQDEIKFFIVNNNCSLTDKILEYPKHYLNTNKKGHSVVKNIDYKKLKMFEFNLDFCLTEYLMHMEILRDEFGTKCIPSVTNLTEEEKTFDKPYKFFTLMGGRHPHRASLYNMLESENLKKDGLVSAWWKNEFVDVRSYRYDTENAPKNVVHNSTSTKLTTMDDNEWKFWEKLPIPIYYAKNIYKNCYLQIIAESRMNLASSREHKVVDYTFLTEKTAKSLCSNPFIIYGQPHSLKYLKSLGFKTFDGLIDESYDEIMDGDERLNFLNNQVKSLLSGSNEKLKDIYIQSLPILEHNFNTLLKINWKDMVFKLVDLMESKLK